MRDSFVTELHALANENDNIICLAGDIGFKVFDAYRAEHPHAFLNVGIAEANMVGMASGLSTCGLLPVVYTIIPFLTMRAFEQIRVDLAMHNRHVMLVGVGGGYSYDYLGPTHHALEDVAIMATLPNVKVYVPRDPASVRTIFSQTLSEPGVKYLRLGKNKEPAIVGRNLFLGENGLLSGEIIKSGKDAVIIGRGPILSRALEAAQLLEIQGVDCAVLDLPCVNFQPELVAEYISHFSSAVVIDEAYSHGGLGQQIAAVIAENAVTVKFRSLCVTHKFNFDVNGRDVLLNQAGLAVEDIVHAVFSQ